MDIKVAAAETAKRIKTSRNFELYNRPALCEEHLLEMADKIVSGEITGEKAHRWLGWLQAGANAAGCATLEELKLINYKAYVDHESF